MSRSKYLISALGVGLAAFLATSGFSQANGAGAQFCKKYANHAVKHYHKNIRLGCGFSGFEWHAWKSGHRDWCRITPKGIVQIGHDNRVAKLARCSRNAGIEPLRPNNSCKTKHVTSVKLLRTKALARANAAVKAKRKIANQCIVGKITRMSATHIPGRGYLGNASYKCCN